MILRASQASREFISEINTIAVKLGSKNLSNVQIAFLSFCISAMVVLGSLNFAAFSAGSLGLYAVTRLSWMFHKSAIVWHIILISVVVKVLNYHGISKVNLVIDDTDRSRSKVISRWRETRVPSFKAPRLS